MFLQLNLLHKAIEFTAIGSLVFNRGSEQEDIAYSHTALINFRSRCYPHITVGTLTKAF